MAVVGKDPPKARREHGVLVVVVNDNGDPVLDTERGHDLCEGVGADDVRVVG
jgi:hypothetical protein